MDFEIGDVVRFKAGGPKMTVTATDEDSEIVRTVWFSRDDTLQTEVIPPQAIYKLTNIISDAEGDT